MPCLSNRVNSSRISSPNSVTLTMKMANKERKMKHIWTHLLIFLAWTWSQSQTLKQVVWKKILILTNLKMCEQHEIQFRFIWFPRMYFTKSCSVFETYKCAMLTCKMPPRERERGGGGECTSAHVAAIIGCLCWACSSCSSCSCSCSWMQTLGRREIAAQLQEKDLTWVNSGERCLLPSPKHFKPFSGCLSRWWWWWLLELFAEIIS